MKKEERLDRKRYQSHKFTSYGISKGINKAKGKFARKIQRRNLQPRPLYKTDSNGNYVKVG